jgi:hypothetical protein
MFCLFLESVLQIHKVQLISSFFLAPVIVDSGGGMFM